MKDLQRFAAVAVIAAACAAQFSRAQSPAAPSSDAENPKEQTFWPVPPLAAPVYPPLPRQARIMGDVKVRVRVHRDGTVVSAEVVSGPPLLRQAALESAQKSKFHCWPDCTDDVTTFDFTYTFGMREGGSPCETERLRAAKCLYLWRCGLWQSVAGQPPTVGESVNRVIVLADETCVQTNTASGGVNTLD